MHTGGLHEEERCSAAKVSFDSSSNQYIELMCFPSHSTLCLCQAAYFFLFSACIYLSSTKFHQFKPTETPGLSTVKQHIHKQPTNNQPNKVVIALFTYWRRWRCCVKPLMVRHMHKCVHTYNFTYVCLHAHVSIHRLH